MEPSILDGQHTEVVFTTWALCPLLPLHFLCFLFPVRPSGQNFNENPNNLTQKDRVMTNCDRWDFGTCLEHAQRSDTLDRPPLPGTCSGPAVTTLKLPWSASSSSLLRTFWSAWMGVWAHFLFSVLLCIVFRRTMTQKLTWRCQGIRELVKMLSFKPLLQTQRPGTSSFLWIFSENCTHLFRRNPLMK